MSKWTWLMVGAVGLSWSLLLLPWVYVGEQSKPGTELSELLALLPLLAILMLLISLYGKAGQLLRIGAIIALGFASFISFTTNFVASPASVALQESISGIVGEDTLATLGNAHLIFGASQALLAMAGLALLLVNPPKLARQRALDESDSRTIWEEQSE
jgi:hypothetical protein